MAKATVTISAKDNMSQGLNQAKKSVMQFQQSIDKVGSALSKAFKITSLTAGIVALGKSLTDCVKAFNEADRVAQRMTAVWENVGTITGKSARQMDDLAEAIEKETYFSSEAIKEAGLLLAATEALTDDGFDRALQASLDLATAMGTDVTASAQTLAKALQAPDEAFKSLKSVGVAFTDAEKDQIKTLIENNELLEAQDLILGRVEQKYQGVAKAVADTPSAKLKQIRDTWGDIKETLGRGIVEALNPAFKFILDMLTKISQWAKEHMDEKHFWSDADTGDSHKLFRSYSSDFLNEKRGESTSMISEQIKRLADTDWGKIIKQYGHWNMETLLAKDKAQIEMIAEWTATQAYGKNFEDHLGTVEGFMEMIADQYDPLLAQLKTIDGALQEYAEAASLDIPDFGTGGGSSGGSSGGLDDTVPEPTELEKILSKYGKMSVKWQMAELDKQIESIQKVYDDASFEEQGYLNQILGTLIEQKTILEGNGGSGTSGSGSGYEPEIVKDPKLQAFEDSVFGSLFNNLGEMGHALSSLTTNIAQMGPALGTLMTGLDYLFQGLGQALAPFVNVLTTTILQPLVEVGKAIGSLILPVLELLTPVLNLFANIVLTITGTFSYIGQLLQHWVATVLNWLASIDLLGWRPFAGLATYDPGAPGSLKDYLANYKSSIFNSSADSEATKQSVSSASYRGATNVVINIYQEAPVVGDNGMRQFAQMIRDEFEALDYYGVTA